jgi:hypothetical protein
MRDVQWKIPYAQGLQLIWGAKAVKGIRTIALMIAQSTNESAATRFADIF